MSSSFWAETFLWHCKHKMNKRKPKFRFLIIIYSNQNATKNEMKLRVFMILNGRMKAGWVQAPNLEPWMVKNESAKFYHKKLNKLMPHEVQPQWLSGIFIFIFIFILLGPSYTNIRTPCWASNEGELPPGVGAQTRPLWNISMILNKRIIRWFWFNVII